GRLVRRGAGARRLGLGNVTRLPRCARATHSGAESADDGIGRGVRAALERARGAGRRVLAPGRRCRSKRRVLGGDGEWAPGELRPAEVPGAAEWADGDWAALPRRVDVLRGAA